MSFKRWILPDLDKEGASLLAEECEIHPFLALLLHARGVRTPEDVQAFLWDDMEDSDPFSFPDMELAVARLQQAMDSGESIMVFGDYDADGITATVLLYTYLKEHNANVTYHIPTREEGYGLNNARLEEAAQKGVTLIVTVDNGIAAVDETAYARSLGMDVIITDHHQPQDILPQAIAVVDPHRKDCDMPFRHYAGVGVAYALVCALEGDSDTVLEQFGDLVAIGTLADVMPLEADNRRLVRAGLQQINQRPRTGVLALLQVAGAAEKALTSSSAVFTLSPRINAAGRMSDPNLAARLLLAQTPETALALAEEMQQCNLQRQNAELAIMEEVFEEVRRHPEWMSQRVLVIEGEGWHQGVVGIVAARVLERYGKPCVVMSINGETAKGSGRSLAGFPLFDAIAFCESLLLGFGGHELAAGVTMQTANIEAFRRQINIYAAEHMPDMPVRELRLDCKLRPSQIDLEKLQLLAAMEPFGNANPTPIFGLFGMTLDNITPVGNGKHLRLSVSRDGCRLSVMHFHCTVDELSIPCGSRVHLAVTLDRNEYRGVVSPSIIVKDIRYADTDQEVLLDGIRTFDKVCRRELTADKEAVVPSREQLAHIYRFLKGKGIFKGNVEQLWYAVDKTASCATLLTALRVFSEADLLEVEMTDDRLCLQCKPTTQKADLNATPTMQYLVG